MKRGDLVTIAVSGDFGKPRPALIIQADSFEALGSVTVLRLTSALHRRVSSSDVIYIDGWSAHFRREGPKDRNFARPAGTE